MKMRNQLSIPYFDIVMPSRFGDLYTTFLVEDVSQNVWPFGYGASERLNSVELKPNEDHVRQILTAALARDEHGFEASLQDFLTKAAGQVAEHDFAVAEIVFTQDDETNMAESVEFVWINPRHIIKRWGHFYQRVPVALAVERGIKSRVLLPSERIMVFSAPPRYKKSLAQAREALSIMSDHRNDLFSLQAMEQNFQYDFTVHNRARLLALAEAGRPIGYACRGMFNEQAATPYWIRLKILHEAFLIELRQSLLKTLNAGLKKTGDKIGFECQIEVSGWPTLHDVEVALNQLDAGAPSLVDILDTFSRG
jgi:hypothetical protein